MPYRDYEAQKARRRELYHFKKEKDPLFLKKKRDYNTAWRILNPERIKKLKKRWEQKVGINVLRKLKSRYSRERRQFPWIRTYYSIFSRLRRSKNLDKYGNKYRCYVGIRMLMSTDDLKFLWERDKAELMVHPSIDRKDSKDDYILENCQYIEMKDNRDKVIRNYY